MTKILFLPFLEMQTGHHKVADALICSLASRFPNASLQKVDVLSFSHRKFEKVVRNIYLKCIDSWPKIYKHIYERLVYPSTSPTYLKWFEALLHNTTLHLIFQEQADLIVCTQAYPSFVLSRLKEQGKVKTPVINVYTDFFINEIWGYKGIDYHFVPDHLVKNELLEKHRISGERIIVTGIPVDESFTYSYRSVRKKTPYQILISGGNSGLGDIIKLLKRTVNCSEFVFLVLCGNNKQLFKKLMSWGLENIRPFSYIASSKEVSSLYDQADAIITKPGGVTISEALQKRLPIFVYSILPGQEEVNLRHLESQGLVYTLHNDRSIRDQLLSVLTNESELNSLNKRIQEFHQNLDIRAWEMIMEIIKHTEREDNVPRFIETRKQEISQVQDK